MKSLYLSPWALPALAAVLAPAAALAAPTCAQNAQGLWQMRNGAGLWIGSEQAWKDKADCDGLVASSLNGNLVCSWNGQKFRIYNADNGVALGAHTDENGYNDGPGCAGEAKKLPASSPFACGWDGAHYQPLARANNKILAPPGNGYNTMDDCVANSLQTVSPQGVCTWDGAWTIYFSDATASGVHFGTVEQCQGFQKAFLRRLSGLDVAKKFAAALSVEHPALPSAFISGVPDKQVGFTRWADCGVREYAYHLAKAGQDGYLVPECTPDTLYSWGDLGKVGWFEDNLKDGGKWPDKLPRTLYNVLSAANTFGYGDYPIRIKLKPGTRIKLLVSDAPFRCEDLSEGLALWARLVQRSGGFSFMEYNICSTSVIESWSFGTREQVDEILRDDAWMRGNDYKLWEGYAKDNGVDRYLGSDIDGGAGLYNTDFSEASLIRRLWLNKTVADFELGEIHYPRGAAHDVGRHFSTAHPIFFNPN